jgi:DNA-binding MarR family transcriptional regulator
VWSLLAETRKIALEVDQVSQGGDSWDEMRLAAMLRSGWRRAQGTMTKALSESGLSGLEYHVLLAISAVGETGIRQVDLAQELSVPEGKISVLARHLGERKLIEALRSEPDRRYVRLRLKPAGLRVLRAAMHAQRQHLAGLVRQFPEQDVVQMIEFVIKSYLGLDLTVQPREPAARPQVQPQLPAEPRPAQGALSRPAK